MTTKEMAFRTEDCQMKAWTVFSLAMAVNDAVYQGTANVSDYEGAMLVLIQLAAGLVDELKETTEMLFDELQEVKK